MLELTQTIQHQIDCLRANNPAAMWDTSMVENWESLLDCLNAPEAEVFDLIA